MNVILTKRCELAVQAVLFLSAQSNNQYTNAGEIANTLDAPKEFVSKILQTLKKNRLIDSRKGKNGGFYLSKPADSIRLIDIVLTIDGLEVFHKCVLGFKGCSIENPCPVHDKWGVLRDHTYKMLSEETLEDLRKVTQEKIGSLRKKDKVRNNRVK